MADSEKPEQVANTLDAHVGLHAELVRAAAVWLRKKCSVVFTEVAGSARETADAIGWNGMRSILIECKTSRSDFRADAKKPWRRHADEAMGAKRYYLSPRGLLRVADLPPRWGLLEWDGRKVREVVPAQYQDYNARNEVSVMVSVLRRIGQVCPGGVSIKVYTFQTKNTATCSVAMDEQPNARVDRQPSAEGATE